MKVFFSNRYEVLAHRLGEDLFLNEKDPFSKRFIIVGSQAVKNDLLRRWAEDSRFQVAMGVVVMTLGQALDIFFPKVPSMMELSLKIEANLEKSGVIESYLQGGGAKRLSGLCNELSLLFLKQGTFCGKPFNEPWLQQLWEKVGLSWESHQNIKGSIYLFNLPFLPKQYLDFFKKNARAGFFISPTALYWGDVATPREQHFLLEQAPEVQKAELEGYFQEQNQLITHLGKMGRRLWLELQEEDIEELYVEPKGLALHEQMMNLEPVKFDESIEIHVAASKAREVEVVWELLQSLDANYNEVIVLAPDINEYVPYIHKVFQGEDYSITGLEIRPEPIEHLFSLPQLKFSIHAILKLFSYTSFLEKFELSTEDVFIIKKWTDQANFEVGNWDAGFERILRALASIPEEGDPEIEFSQTEILSKWIEILQLLKKALEPVEQNIEMGVDEWMEYFQKTISQFFVVESDEMFFAEMKRYAGIKVGRYSFESIQRVLQEIFRKKTGAFQTGSLSALRFATLSPGFIVPARVFIVMGMKEGEFPRIEKRNPLTEIDGDYCPTTLEEDRYALFEILLAMREKLILTYASIDPDDGKEVRPSLLIEELFSKVPIQRHPQIFFGKALRSSSILSASGKKPLISIPSELKRKEEQMIDLRHLKKLARHPIEFFLQRKCGIYFEREKKRDREFVLSHLDLAYFRRASLKKKLDEILPLAEEKGKLPIGHFRAAAISRIKEDIEEYQTALKALGVRKEEIFSVEFKASCEAPLQMRENEWILPPLECYQSRIQLVGRLDEICPQGVLFHGEDRLEDWLKAWPLYLTGLNLPIPIEKTLLLTKKGAKKEFSFQDPKEALSRYIDYYLAASENISILMPKWGGSILQKGVLEPEESTDEILSWFLQRDNMDWIPDWLTIWSPLLKKVYREAL